MQAILFPSAKRGRWQKGRFCHQLIGSISSNCLPGQIKPSVALHQHLTFSRLGRKKKKKGKQYNVSTPPPVCFSKNLVLEIKYFKEERKAKKLGERNDSVLNFCPRCLHAMCWARGIVLCKPSASKRKTQLYNV